MGKRNRKKNQQSSAGVRIVSIAEMIEMREQLEQVCRPGTDPVKQAAVITWAMQYRNAYYYTSKRTLRRVFPKATDVVLFDGVKKQGEANAASHS